MKSEDALERKSFEELLTEVRKRYVTAQKSASLAAESAHFLPIEEAGKCIRDARERQELTLKDLCELSGVAYSTLCKIEKGHPSARMDNIMNVTKALGLKLRIG